MTESGIPAKRVIVDRALAKLFPSTASNSTLLAERSELKHFCDAVVLEIQCSPGLVYEVWQLRVSVAGVKKATVSVRGASAKGKEKKWLPVAGKCVIALMANLKELRDALKQIMKCRRIRETGHRCCSSTCNVPSTYYPV